LYSSLRFVASASLVALANVVGVLALYPDAIEELLVASAEISDPPAACQQQDWWQLDRSCLSRRGMPWVATAPESNAVPSAAEGAPEQPLTDNRSAASAPAQMTQQNEAAAPQQETPAPPPVAEERQIPTQRSEAAAPQQETPAPPPVAEERQIPTQRSEVAASPGDASATAARGGTAHRRAAQRSRDAPAGDVTAAAGRRRKTHPEAAARSHGASTRDASGRGTACAQTCGRGAATRGRSKESNARGSSRETTAHQRGVECRATVSRRSARYPREWLCRRRDTADDRHPADVNPGCLLLLCAALEGRGARPHALLTLSAHELVGAPLERIVGG
jgi:hypothetical protein